MSDLNITIGADISQYQAGMQQASAVSGAAMDKLKADLQSYEELKAKTFDPALHGQYNNQIKNIQTSINRLGKEAEITANDTKDIAKDGISGMSALGGATVSASMKFQQMRSGISAARDGLMGFTIGGQAGDRMLMAMGHHINSLVNETGSFSGAMKAMGSALMGPGGIILGLTAAFELFQHFSKGENDAYDATQHFTDSLDAQHNVIRDLDGSYGEAVKDVYELTENVKLAKEGFVSKSEVVKEYNDTLGKTMGSVKTLDEVERKLVSGTADYVKMMLYKAAAQTALKEASDKAVEASKAQMKSDDESLGFLSKAKNVLNQTITNAGMGGGLSGVTQKFTDKAKQQDAAADRAKEVADFNKDKDQLLKIADDFQTQAAQISKAHNWNFLPDQEKKVAKAKEGFAIIEAEIRKVETDLENALMNNAPPTVLNGLANQLTALNVRLDALKEKMMLVFFPNINKTLSTDNNTTKDSISAITPTLKNQDMSPSEIERGAKAFKDETDAKFASYLATKKYKEENKAAAETLRDLTNVIGGGLMDAFQKALSGTQSFVSAMGHFLLQLIEKLIAAAAAAAVLAVLLSATGFGAALGSGSSFGSLFSTLSGFKGLASHASGGIFTQAHVGMFAEAGPEAIVTPKHLAEFAGVQKSESSEGWQHGQIVGILRGSDIQLQYLRSAKTKSRTS